MTAENVKTALARPGSKTREKPQKIADELRQLPSSANSTKGTRWGTSPKMIERFGVSRPSLREALRILEAEGLITSAVRGVQGGVVVHRPDKRLTAHRAAIVLPSRDVRAVGRLRRPHHGGARGRAARGVSPEPQGRLRVG